MENNDIKRPEIIELGKRIKRAIKETGMDQDEFALLLGVDPPQISKWVKGENAPSYEYLVKIGKQSNVCFDWLLTGEGEFRRRIFQVQEPLADYGLKNEFVMIPQTMGKISTGGGLIPDNRIELRVAFRKEWIQRKGLPENMSLIRVEGRSMEPTLQNGDIVLIDHSKNYFEGDTGIYAVVMGEDIKLKRLQKIYPSSKIRIISDNPKHLPDEVNPEDLTINGKAVWFGREIEE